MEKQEGIFDRIMALPLLSKFAPFYKKHKSVLLYLLFGGLTTVVSIGTYALFLPVVSPLIANIISWVAAVTFAYVTNRTWVFASKEKGLAIIQEAFAFYGGRVVVLYVFITLLFFPPLTVKVFAQVIVLILNYVISKLFVFKK